MSCSCTDACVSEVCKYLMDIVAVFDRLEKQDEEKTNVRLSEQLQQIQLPSLGLLNEDKATSTSIFDELN